MSCRYFHLVLINNSVPEFFMETQSWGISMQTEKRWIHPTYDGNTLLILAVGAFMDTFSRIFWRLLTYMEFYFRFSRNRLNIAGRIDDLSNSNQVFSEMFFPQIFFYHRKDKEYIWNISNKKRIYGVYRMGYFWWVWTTFGSIVRQKWFMGSVLFIPIMESDFLKLL